MKKNLILLLLICLSGLLQAQNNGIEMAEELYENGKIYIVVISVLIILVGFFLYLIGLDRKVKRIEKKLDENKH